MSLNILGAQRFALREARKLSKNTPRIEVEIRRGDDVQSFDQEILKNDEDLKLHFKFSQHLFLPPV